MRIHHALLALVAVSLVIAASLAPITHSAISHWFTVLSKGDPTLRVVGVANIGNYVYVINSTYDPAREFFSIVNISKNEGAFEIAYAFPNTLAVSGFDYVPSDRVLYTGMPKGGVAVIDLGTLVKAGSADVYLIAYRSGKSAPVRAVAVTESYIVAVLEPGNEIVSIAILDRSSPTTGLALYNVSLINPAQASSGVSVTDVDAFETSTTLVIAVAGTYIDISNNRLGVAAISELDISSGFPTEADVNIVETKSLYGPYPVGVTIGKNGEYVYIAATDSSPGSLIFNYSVTTSSISDAVLITGAGSSYVPLLIKVKEAANGDVYAFGMSLNTSGTSDMDVAVLELGSNLAPINAWVIGGEYSEILNSTGAIDVTDYVFIGGSTESFRDDTGLLAPFTMLFSPGITNGSDYRWVTTPPTYSHPSDGPTTLVTDSIDYSGIGGPAVSSETMVDVGLDIKTDSIYADKVALDYYTAENADLPVPVPEPITIVAAIAVAVAVTYVVFVRRRGS